MQNAPKEITDWTWPEDIFRQVQRFWERGDLLRALIAPQLFFPKRCVLKRPRSLAFIQHFETIRRWCAALKAMPSIRLEEERIHHRLLGVNVLPKAVWIDDVQSAIKLIDKEEEMRLFENLLAHTAQHQPKLMDWLYRYPLKALCVEAAWRSLLTIVNWLQMHPKPEIYVRQLALNGVHTKFVEQHQGLLNELLEIVLEPGLIDQRYGVHDFAKRYGFLDKPERIRFRILDPAYRLFANGAHSDITLDVATFRGLTILIKRVFIVENEINFLAFPPMRSAMVIFGSGYGFEGLGQVRWLAQCDLYYWGDLDTHGFAILDELRRHFKRVKAFLMDRVTLLAFESQWGIEPQPTRRDLGRLVGEEQDLYDDLRFNRIQKQLRLEQERISFEWVLERLRGFELL